MPIESFYPDQVGGLGSDTMTNPAAVLGAPDGVFSEDVEGNSWEQTFLLPVTLQELDTAAGLPTFRVTCRTSTTATVASLTRFWIDDGSGGVLAESTSTYPITDDVSQLVEAPFLSWAAQPPALGQFVRVGVQCEGVSGGNPGNRASVQVDAVECLLPVAGPASPSHLQSWDGGDWVEGALFRWDGGGWAPGVLRRWTGSGWEVVP